jgi:ABC-type phosphate/phosphonate transport system substrate-binding protein
MAFGGAKPLYRELIEPRFTPMGAVTAVTEHKADVAPVDSYAFALLQSHAPELTARVRVIARTERTAVPALVASGAANLKLAAAFLGLDKDPESRPLMDELLLRRFAVPNPPEYDALRVRFETMTAFWRCHPLAETIHPAFAEALGVG